MIKNIQILALSFLMLSLFGCGFQHDPYKDRGVDKAVAPVGDAKLKFIENTSLYIEGDDVFSFKEGEAGTFKLQPRLVPNGIITKSTKAKIQMDLSEFPFDANKPTFNEATGEFNWKPSLDFVNSEETHLRRFTINAYLYTDTNPVLVKKKSIDVVVTSVFNIPEIVDFDSFPRSISENDTRIATVWVKDLDSTTNPPNLIIGESKSGYKTAALGININTVNYDASKNMWAFKLNISYEDFNFQTSDESIYLDVGFRVISINGMSSSITNKTMEVELEPQEPIGFIDDNYTLKAGQMNELQFVFVTPLKRGEISVENNSGDFNIWAGAPTFKCEDNLNNIQNKVCNLKWFVPETEKGKSFNLRLKAKNTGKRKTADANFRSSLTIE